MKKPPRKVTKPASAGHEDALFARVVDIIEAARGHVSRSVNTAMVQAYRLIGREIVEVEQHGDKRAGYGDEVTERLAQRRAGSVEGSAQPPALGGLAKRTAALSKSRPDRGSESSR